jgi:predicted small integral membrane protein
MLWPLGIVLFLGAIAMIVIGSIGFKDMKNGSTPRVGNLSKGAYIAILVIGVLLLAGGIFPALH